MENTNYNFEQNQMNFQTQMNGQPSVPPKSYLLESVLVAVFCSVIFGVIAIVYALKVDDCFYVGDYLGAQRASNEARKYMKIGLIVGIVVRGVFIIIPILLVLFLGLGAFGFGLLQGLSS